MMSYQAKALKKIKELEEKFSSGGYIFRGTTDRYSLQKGHKKVRDGINSTLYRWVVKSEKTGEIAKEKKNLKKIFSENDHFFPENMEKEIIENIRRMTKTKAKAHEILTNLQHFGGNTNMIDFSRCIYVALFFACQSEFKKPGELIALRTDMLKKIDEINHEKQPQKGEMEIIVPAKTRDSKRRAKSQKSVFVRPANGYIEPNPKLCVVEKIAGNIKKHILDLLWTRERIDHNAIYNDLHGFIKNEKNNETPSLYFYMGKANTDEGIYKALACDAKAIAYHKKAIRHYDKSIEYKPNTPDVAGAYCNRGVSYKGLKKYVEAIEDFDKSLSLRDSIPEAYSGRGSAYYALAENKSNAEGFAKALPLYNSAIRNYGNAISRKPDFPEAYHGKGNVYYALAENKFNTKGFAKALPLYNSAIRNYGNAISRKPDFHGAYKSRGDIYGDIGECYEFIKDFGTARFFYELANKDYSDAIKHRKNCVGARKNLNWAKAKISRTKGAVIDFAKIEKLGIMLPEDVLSPQK